MIPYKFVPYQQNHSNEWADFLTLSKNGTFLFDRSYMEYHKDRFQDHSLLCYDHKDELIALLPASSHGDKIVSHGGLTYGGLICTTQMTTPIMVGLVDALSHYLQSLGVKALDYKTIPALYHQYPAEEDRYALFLKNATLYRRDIYSVIDLGHMIPPQNRRLRMKKKAEKQKIELAFNGNYSVFWDMLSENLQAKHGAKPVHSLEEITRLQHLFPNNIQLCLAQAEGRVGAGCVLYETATALHCQYIASTEEGRAMGWLDLLFFYLIDHYQKIGKRYFSFGISNEQDGRVLNTGLVEFKEGFGARSMIHDFYRLNCA